MATSDAAFKVATIVIGVIVVPTFGWVWNTDRNLQGHKLTTEAKIASIEAQVAQTVVEVSEIEETSRDIRVIKRDIEYIRESVDQLRDEVQ